MTTDIKLDSLHVVVNRKQGLDYSETFSSVVSLNTLRFLIAYAENFEDEQGSVVKLKKSLYGLKQVPRAWNKRCVDFLKAHGLHQLITDKSVFNNKIDEFMMKLNTEFEVRITDNPEIIVGLEIENARGFINIYQESYMDQLLTPAVSGTDNSEDCNGMEGVNFPYREAVGCLLYLLNRSRPDITYAVNMASRKMENLTVHDVKKLKRIFRYLQGTKNLGLRYSANLNTSLIDAYSDADYAGDELSHRSTSGYVILYMGSPVA
ncbi:hypothetical protein PR048_001713 [Dryococelus australis]|uniref:Reverse transcriptase Ty1/copia-type domain-containing protein n=1 Tax=Dryococelus australis TaxID=614101 RepID=A0ABQ9IIB0_9NEOP|nr:hypothetical protein PR048_001713 [Dryococelus australis]